MSAIVTITPLRSGGAVAELSSDLQIFPDWRTAAEEADRRNLVWRLARPDSRRTPPQSS